jgi:hypothetical protein
MPKKSKRKRRSGASDAARPSDYEVSKRRSYYLTALSGIILLIVGTAASRFNDVRRAVGLRPLTAASLAQATPTPLPLSKEYIYAGGRLVATEEPTATPAPTPAGPAPTNLVATANSASSVSLTWTASAAGVLGYVVERKGASGTQEIPTGSTSASFDDSTPSGDYAYLYRVKAVYAGGTSLYSNQDIATTVVFTDNSLQGVTIKAVHLTELRRAVAAVRALAGVGDPSWTYPDPVSQRRAVYLEDVTDLRARLDEALVPMNLWSPYPAEPVLQRFQKVYADHFEQIRSRVR